MSNLIKQGSGEYEDITLEDIEEYLMNIFFNREPSDRMLYGFRSCKNYGIIDINTFFHCGDKTCNNCNFFTQQNEHPEDGEPS